LKELHLDSMDVGERITGSLLIPLLLSLFKNYGQNQHAIGSFSDVSKKITN